MNHGQIFLDPLRRILELGGPVVAILICVSIITLATVLFKLWQFRAAGVGRHRTLQQAIAEWDHGQTPAALRTLRASPSHLAPVVLMAMEQSAPGDRLVAEAETGFARLEGGFRLLDSVVQLSPLLGLFGTVLGMIEAFQSLQQAGSSVDPSLLAGGIWVALMTTAVGLAVAMPSSVVLSWLESRIESDRVMADRAFATVLAPLGATVAAASPAVPLPSQGLVHVT
ncbi:MotA/TolQ/ExbB proton channel family protein [Puniceibacterium sediminis]|uniref:Outer membrane transport energization protein ExbB n=1 Tax=Puniceibacterium sediminis TaxID=1608407 RepID=A0A238YRA6_9RHOB|nr:MotA/TolQ/ExbB proton channel family protein [Puniceibacterium sediminis]SNR73512.1 outer membrane transport energization protein ExbB [Puniceibacterium sediminis]